jgi:LCP family protein required for cell wall assembly
MKRLLFALTLLALLAAACEATPPDPTRPYRTPVPTWTLPFQFTDTPLPPGVTVTPLPSSTEPTATPSPDYTPTPSPTARPGIDPTLGAATPDPFATPVTPIPEPAAQLRLDKDIVNLLLLGRDTARETNNYRTDVMIVVSVNKKANSVMLLTLPRDLFVYVPGWTMNRLNTAAGHGDAIGYPGGGVALLEQTILYNFGIPIHGWARIDFGGFKEVVDILGGVDVPVTCEMTDWRLKDPSYALDDQDPDHWELYTVSSGVQHMDGNLALWYARSRKHSSDFDRSRRQHQVLRAMFDKGLQLDALTKAPDLYAQYVKIVDTDLGLGDILQFVPVAAQLDSARIKSRFIGLDQVWRWTTPQGAAVLIPDREAIARVIDEAFRPPSDNVLAREATAVEVWNGTPNAAWADLAAANLEWAGIRPVIGPADSTAHPATVIYDFTTSAKGSALPELQRLFRVSDANVIAAPDPNAPYPFRVVLGADYDSCVAPVRVPHGTPTPSAPPPTVPQGEIVHTAGIKGPPPPTDGDLIEWTHLVYAVDQPVFGRENWAGPDDLSARWNLAWDQQYLYLALQVQDDVYVPAAPGENLYKGDSLELLLNTDPGSRVQNTLTDHDFQLGIALGDLSLTPLAPEAYLWLPEDEARSIAGVVVAARLVEGGYNVEVAIPWLIFRVAPPFAGEGFAFALTLNDDDTPSSAEQETQVSSVKDRKLVDPFTWGIMVLDLPPP